MILALSPPTGSTVNWPVLIAAITGFLAVRYLLPTPRRRSALTGMLLLALAVAGFGTLLFSGLGRLSLASVEVVLFVIFSLMAVLFGILTITQRNPARSAIYFAVVILHVCGLFLLQGAPFLSAATIIIYAGAIIVTFLFVLMLSHYGGPSDENDRTREPSLSAATGFMVLAILLVGLQRVYDTSAVDAVIARANGYAEAETVDETLRSPDATDAYVGQVREAQARLGYPYHADPARQPAAVRQHLRDLGDANWDLLAAAGSDLTPEMSRGFNRRVRDDLVYLKSVREGTVNPNVDVKLSPYSQARSVAGAGESDIRGPNQLPAANVAALGRSLFTDHLISVELGGTLLLVATIGAIAIAGGRRKEVEA